MKRKLFESLNAARDSIANSLEGRSIDYILIHSQRITGIMFMEIWQSSLGNMHTFDYFNTEKGWYVI